MIVNIRGLSGSGKSTSVKRIIDTYDAATILSYNKKRPMCYKLEKANYNPLIVLGPYDDLLHTCGGDTFDYNEQLRILIEEYDNAGYDILFEHCMLSGSNKFVLDLAKTRQVAVLFLNIDPTIVKQQRTERSKKHNKNSNLTTDTGILTQDVLLNAYNQLSDTNVKHKMTTHASVVDDFYFMLDSTKRDILAVDDFQLSLRVKYTTSVSNSKKQLPNDLFSFD
jgi:ABC-type dipeptide/oligopeptide/nickel transport system ATPase component